MDIINNPTNDVASGQHLYVWSRFLNTWRWVKNSPYNSNKKKPQEPTTAQCSIFKHSHAHLEICLSEISVYRKNLWHTAYLLSMENASLINVISNWKTHTKLGCSYIEYGMLTLDSTTKPRNFIFKNSNMEKCIHCSELQNRVEIRTQTF